MLVTAENSSKIETALSAEKRRRGVDPLVEKLTSAGLDFELLPDDVHAWVVGCFRAPDPPYSGRRDLPPAPIRDLAPWLRRCVDGQIFDQCLAFNYSILDFPAVIVRTAALIDAIEKDFALLSVDGFVLTNKHVTHSIIVDYDGADPFEDSALISLLGKWPASIG